MKVTFEIEFAKKRKISNIGAEIVSFGFLFLFIFGLCLLPAKYLPFEIATIYLLEVVNRNIYIVLSCSSFLVIFGSWLKGLRKYEKAELELKSDGISMTSLTRNMELKYDEIKKFGGTLNIVHGMKSIHKINFIIKTINNERIEIRSHSDIFNELTDYFPEKV
ncbi:hypothetical protein ACFQ3R_05870 [Mesonia ostreae]|uniref:DUF304 domain-containing protein n=1 Tax=Mesonia ostreae TaxID=861110 RepID=A0ABU2KJP8_9FLAO|nr:hypothetical protein [Mesonia ostreae]MDT0294947.1 hypothetical protein [Mesonia ostreae]